MHKLRGVDQDFDSDYMLPQLKRDEGVGELADALVSLGEANGESQSASVKALLGSGGNSTAASPSVAGSLLNLLTRSESRIEVTKPGTKNAVQLDLEDVANAVKGATFDGVRAKQATIATTTRWKRRRRR